jgi:hypothetical protein
MTFGTTYVLLFHSRQRRKPFFLKALWPALGRSQPPVQRVMTEYSVLPEGEQLWREWSYAVTSPYTCMAYTGTPLSFYSIFRAFTTEVTKKSLLSSCLTVCNKPKFSELLFLFHLTLADFWKLLPVFKSDNNWENFSWRLISFCPHHVPNCLNIYRSGKNLEHNYLREVEHSCQMALLGPSDTT